MVESCLEHISKRFLVEQLLNFDGFMSKNAIRKSRSVCYFLIRDVLCQIVLNSFEFKTLCDKSEVGGK